MTYEASGRSYPLKSGHFLLLPPRKLHRVLNRSADAASFSITFHLDRDASELTDIPVPLTGSVTELISQDIHMILTESNRSERTSDRLVAGNILEILIFLWRRNGFIASVSQHPDITDDPRLIMARQYILDNIDRSPTVPEVASY